MQAEDSNALTFLLEEWYNALDIDKSGGFQAFVYLICFRWSRLILPSISREPIIHWISNWPCYSGQVPFKIMLVDFQADAWKTTWFLFYTIFITTWTQLAETDKADTDNAFVQAVQTVYHQNECLLRCYLRTILWTEMIWTKQILSGLQMNEAWTLLWVWKISSYWCASSYASLFTLFLDAADIHRSLLNTSVTCNIHIIQVPTAQYTQSRATLWSIRRYAFDNAGLKVHTLITNQTLPVHSILMRWQAPRLCHALNYIWFMSIFHFSPDTFCLLTECCCIFSGNQNHDDRVIRERTWRTKWELKTTARKSCAKKQGVP